MTNYRFMSESLQEIVRQLQAKFAIQGIKLGMLNFLTYSTRPIVIQIYRAQGSKKPYMAVSTKDAKSSCYSPAHLLRIHADEPLRPGQTIEGYIKENFIPQYIRYLP